MKLIYMKVLFFMFSDVLKGNLLDKCPGYLPRDGTLWAYQDICIQIVIDHVSWNKARRDCQKRKGDLVQIRDAGTQNFVATNLAIRKYTDNKFWIGASDRHHEGSWVWTAGDEHMTYGNWHPGQGPLNKGFLFHGLEDCALLDTADAFRWHDYPCSGGVAYHFFYICQYNMVQVGSTTTFTISSNVSTTQSRRKFESEKTTVSHTNTDTSPTINASNFDIQKQTTYSKRNTVSKGPAGKYPYPLSSTKQSGLKDLTPETLAAENGKTEKSEGPHHAIRSHSQQTEYSSPQMFYKLNPTQERLHQSTEYTKRSPQMFFKLKPTQKRLHQSIEYTVESNNNVSPDYKDAIYPIRFNKEDITKRVSGTDKKSTRPRFQRGASEKVTNKVLKAESRRRETTLKMRSTSEHKENVSVSVWTWVCVGCGVIFILILVFVIRYKLNVTRKDKDFQTNQTAIENPLYEDDKKRPLQVIPEEEENVTMNRIYAPSHYSIDLNESST